jgi:two-component system chemotaxis response regulator CheB
MINVLIVEDSPVVQELLKFILASDPEINVMGVASNGQEAIEFLEDNKPDVITMDLLMPKLDGYKATRMIMETNPAPIIIVSATVNPEEVKKTWQAMEMGAVAALQKPKYEGKGHIGETGEKLIKTVKMMSQVKVVRRWKQVEAQKQPKPKDLTRSVAQMGLNVELVAIAASTGGPLALKIILERFKADFPAPIFIVQHISKGFTQGFVEWLNKGVALDVRLAVDGERARPGSVYVAADNRHLQVGPGMRMQLTSEPPQHGLRPSASFLFRSVAKQYPSKAIGVILTGMGTDGGDELKGILDSGGITIAQDEKTSVVHGMPGNAIALGAAKYVAPPVEIAAIIEGAVGKPN